MRDISKGQWIIITILLAILAVVLIALASSVRQLGQAPSPLAEVSPDAAGMTANTPAETAPITATLPAATRTATPTRTPTATRTATLTRTPTPTATQTETPSPTQEPTATPSGLTRITANEQWTPHSQRFGRTEMMLVPVGCFTMGSQQGDPDEQPAHQMCFDTPFWIDKFEVTNGQYGSEGNFGGPTHPRETVTWLEASAHCQGRGARLPTEAEWEYAARGPSGWVYPWGNSFIAQHVIYVETSRGGTAPVGSRPGGASWVGALDMSGNVWEWTSTLFADYPYRADDGRENPQDASGFRVLRGGAWGFEERYMHAAFREGGDPIVDNSLIGFRCARSE